jgi:hypothetical protein
MSDLKKDYWKYYTRVEYESPVYKIVEDEKGIKTRINKCCFPIKLTDWEEYNQIAYPALAISPLFLQRRLNIDTKEFALFDFVTIKYIQDNAVHELERMFSMAFNEPIIAALYKLGDYQEMRFVFVSDMEIYINKDNYEAVREIMMTQAFYFDPVIGANERSQKVIDKAIQKIINQNKGNEVNIESMISIIRSEFGERDWANYTYYEMKIDYHTIMKKEKFRAIHIYRVLGSKEPIPELGAVCEAHKNPLGEDVLFKKNDRAKDKDY